MEVTGKVIVLRPVHEKAVLPVRATEGSSGYDLVSVGEQLIQPGERALISTGLEVEHIPAGLEIQIRPRSGLAWKQGLTVLNTPGTVDNDYRGEIKVILINLSNQVAHIKPGDRIAQMVVASYKTPSVIFYHGSKNNSTERGSGGFGSTDK